MVPMADEWFRSTAWDDAARVDFEMRLARARPYNQQQYLRIKGISLRHARQMDGARELLERAADFPDGYLHETVSAWESLADMAVERGDRVAAEQLYRRILVEQPSLSGSTGSIEISLAELLLDGGRPQQRDEALELLNSWIERTGMKFDSQLFRWHLALIRIAEATADYETVKRAANIALTLAERGPRLARHPTVGLVEADKLTIKRLRKLAK